MINRRAVLTMLLSFLVVACSGGGSLWSGTITDSAGVELVLNQGEPLWTEAEGWKLTEVLKIGVADGEPEYMFGRVADLGVLSDGRIVVADGIAQHLRFFHPDGRWEKTVGQAGSGPGEFGFRGMAVLVGPGDTLLVVDEQHFRVNQISPDGTWLKSWPSFVPETGWWIGGWDYSPGGRIVSHMVRAPGMLPEEPNPLDFVVTRDFADSKGDTVGWMPSSQTTKVSEGREEYYLWAGQSTASLCPDNSLLTGRQDRYEIRRYGVDGTLEQLVRVNGERVPIGGSDQARMLQHFKELYLDGGFFSLEQVERILAAMHFTETYPAFSTLRCGPSGSIWIQPWRSVSSLTEEELPEIPIGSEVFAAAQFDVFDRQGRYLGEVPLPPGFWPYRFREGHLYGRWRDSLDVEYVKVMKIEGMPHGAASR